mmetsp:Transcript_126780/g.405952  ORF Transcript_126780/g.405952 Transcript_126780/m.405952 type:complete len:230 (+) Transcript_126780:131-820(+)
MLGVRRLLLRLPSTEFAPRAEYGEPRAARASSRPGAEDGRVVLVELGVCGRRVQVVLREDLEGAEAAGGEASEGPGSSWPAAAQRPAAQLREASQGGSTTQWRGAESLLDARPMLLVRTVQAAHRSRPRHGVVREKGRALLHLLVHGEGRILELAARCRQPRGRRAAPRAARGAAALRSHGRPLAEQSPHRRGRDLLRARRLGWHQAHKRRLDWSLTAAAAPHRDLWRP